MRHGELHGPLIEGVCLCEAHCECDEPCECTAYYFEDDGTKVCEDCYGTLDD